MKTKLLLTVLVLITGMQLHAQTARHRMGILHQDSSRAMPHHWHSTARETGPTQSRLIAQTYSKYNGSIYTPVDSTAYTYTGDNGGDLTHPLRYDTAVEYNYNGTYTIEEAIIQTFDANGDIVTVGYPDWDAAAGVYVNDGQELFSYDGNHNVLTAIEQYWDVTNHIWINEGKYIYTYKGNYNDTETDQDWDAPANVWVNTGQLTYSYTTSNSISNILYRNWNNTAWQNNYLRTYTYDAKNNMKTLLYQNWDDVNMLWTNAYQATDTYDTMNNMLAELTETWTGGQRGNSTLVSYSNFVLQQPQTEINQDWDKTSSIWVNHREYNYTYNNLGQETSENQQSWNGTIWLPQSQDQIFRYYYQGYVLSVKSISNSGGNAHIYPVPAHDILHIDLVWDAEQACNVVIYDALGRVCKQWQVPSSAEYHTVITVNDLTAGNYFVNIIGDRGRVVQKLIVSN